MIIEKCRSSAFPWKEDTNWFRREEIELLPARHFSCTPHQSKYKYKIKKQLLVQVQVQTKIQIQIERKNTNTRTIKIQKQ